MKSFRPRLVEKSIIRGFDVRMMFAQAKIRAATDPVAGQEDMEEAILCAEDLGYAEADHDLTAPKMFAGEPELITAWTNGCRSGYCPPFTSMKVLPTKPGGWFTVAFS